MSELKLPWGEPFVIDRFEVDGSVVRLHYYFGDADRPSYRFVETVEFDHELVESSRLNAALRVLHLLAGVSYYKAVAPTAIEVPSLSGAERQLVLAMYDEGLREFAYRNDLGVPLAVDLIERDRSAADRLSHPGELGEPGPVAAGVSASGGGEPNVLIPIGGGKDSALVADLIPTGTLMAVSPKGAQEHLAAHLGRTLRRVSRNLDPRLRDLVAAGALNGHVPVTAINSAIAVALAVSDGFDEVLMGLERSASEPSLVVDGVEVNHQFSKSARAEELLKKAFEPTGVRYLSLLRPMTELAIGAAVGARGLAADIVSCNRVFTIWSENDSSRTQRPCGECAKCLFTALMLAPALTPEQVGEYFGRDLLDEESHLEPVRELWSAEKPFDCVGERHESAAAVALLAQRPGWRDQLIPARLESEALDVLAEVGASPRDFLRIDSVEDLPERYRLMISALDGSSTQ